VRRLIEDDDGRQTELGWWCAGCGAFNGSAKEQLKACRCCEVPREALVVPIEVKVNLVWSDT
jgi:hypothetical protein